MEACVESEGGTAKETRVGLVQVYTGTGKGKTTSSLGLAVRALGQGFKVYMIQFLKSGDTGELFAVKQFLPGMTIVQYGKEAVKEDTTKKFEFDGKEVTGPKGPKDGNFYFPPDAAEREPCRKALEHAFNVVGSGEYDLVILDEVNCAVSKQLISVSDVFKLIEQKPKHVELVLTGRDAPKELVEKADLVSEIQRIKHPYDKGILARRGIEY